MNRIRISHPNRPPQFYSVGATLNPSANPDPNGTVLVTFPDGTETRYPDGTIFNVVVPAVVATPPPVQIAPWCTTSVARDWTNTGDLSWAFAE